MKDIDNVLENACGNKFDVFYNLCNNYLLSSKEPGRALAHIAEYDGKIGTEDDTPPKYLDKEDVAYVETTYGDLLNEIVYVIAQDNLPVFDFYEKLYVNIFKSNLFPSEERYRAVLLKILIEDVRLIPYYYAENLVKMNDLDFRKLFVKLKPKVNEAVHMLNRGFDSLTEVSSQLHRIASSIESNREQVVFWSIILKIIMRKKTTNENND